LRKPILAAQTPKGERFMDMKSKLVMTGLFVVLLTGIGSIGNAGWLSSKPKDVNTTKGQEKELAVVRVPFVRVGNLEFIADELGFFKEKGIKIEWISELKAGTNRFVLLASGAFDYTAGPHTDSVIRVRKSGGKIKIIGGFTDSTKKQPHMVWYVKENSPIRSAKDLIGKKIIGLTGQGEGIELVGCTGYGAAEYLRLSGIDIKKASIEGVTIPVSQIEQVLKQGLVDVATAHPPYTGKLSNTPGFRELFSDYDAIAPTYGRGATSIAVVREEWLQKNPEVARNFIAALALAADWATAHQDEAKAIYAKRLEISSENIKYLSTYAWMPHLFINEKRNIQFYINMMVKNGELKEGKVKPTDVYTRDFNPYYRLVKEGKIKESAILKEAERIAARNYPGYLKNR